MVPEHPQKEANIATALLIVKQYWKIAQNGLSEQQKQTKNKISKTFDIYFQTNRYLLELQRGFQWAGVAQINQLSIVLMVIGN